MNSTDTTESLIREKALLLKWLKKHPTTHKRFALRQEMCISITQELNKRNDTLRN